MENQQGQINGLNIKESKGFIEAMNNINGVGCKYHLQEQVIEFKAIFTPIIITFVTGVSVGLVANVIYDFLKKKKEEGKRVSVNIKDINISQEDNIGIIENKINIFINQ